MADVFTRAGFLRGLRLGVPVMLGYLPVGFAFGVLAVKAGLHPAGVGLMSYFVYAGSAQLIAAGLMASGTGPAGIVLTTFVVNLRHLLMSAAFTPYLRHWPGRLQAWFCFEMTDESFAVNLGRFAGHGVDRGEALGVNFGSHMAWVAGGVAGALFGDVLGDIRPLGLDFALPGMFIALVLPHLKARRGLLAAASGAGLSLALLLLGAGQWSVITATLCAACIAAFWPLPGAEGRPSRSRAVPDGASLAGEHAVPAFGTAAISTAAGVRESAGRPGVAGEKRGEQPVSEERKNAP